MTSRTITLGSNDFFHARPAACIARAAMPFDSVVMVVLGTELANAKDALALMRLPHPQGAAIEFMADGADEEDALGAVLAVVQKDFGLA